MYLVFDTETTDLPNSKLAPDDPKQARVCQIAAILLDEKFVKRGCLYSLVRPDNWTIKPGAQAAHGITQQMCEDYGAPIGAVMDVFIAMAGSADCLVAHNLKFDVQLMTIEASLENKLGSINFESGTNICTMLSTMNHCRLPGKFPGSYKWPKLHEAYSILCKKQLVGAHDALADVSATAELLQWLIQNKQLQTK